MESHCEAEHTEGRIPKPSFSQTGWDPFTRLTSSPGPLQALCPCCFPLYFTPWSLGLAPDYACRYLFPPHKMPLTQDPELSALARLESPLPTSDSAVPGQNQRNQSLHAPPPPENIYQNHGVGQRSGVPTISQSWPREGRGLAKGPTRIWQSSPTPLSPLFSHI